MKYKLKNTKVTASDISLSEDEKKLFRETVKDIQPLHATKVSAWDEHTPLPFPLSDSYPPSFHTDEAVSYLAENSHLSPTILKKIQQGEYPIDRIIDLHGNTLESACRLLSFGIQEAYEHQHRCLLIIHGKGRDAQLKNYTIHWLKQMPWVFYLCSAHQKDGGTGALYVFIKKQKASLQEDNGANLKCVREKIDAIDESLIKLLCQRLAYAKQAAKFKTTLRPDTSREENILRTVRQSVKKLGYPEQYIETIFKTMLEQMRQYQADSDSTTY